MSGFLAGVGTMAGGWVRALAPNPPEEVARLLSRSPREALAEDWRTVGRDLRTAIHHLSATTKASPKAGTKD